MTVGKNEHSSFSSLCPNSLETLCRKRWDGAGATLWNVMAHDVVMPLVPLPTGCWFVPRVLGLMFKTLYGLGLGYLKV